ncbi:hypothetical protein, variant [Aphanomyces invadans]|uniref:Uncharacterized protein n=1 Tax=Aphanomyces invadans TaxID=157072 RepID=A0A024TM92_9STRA|nr:hypothetical protein, variant [Aphanomyces invadans]ETV95158.1 hypothetical protein, variant [Aphanomyces invadans]|eukprot:XP_008876330.1 hypothetical protein, variant [Aphanomyces invadans]
MLRQGDQKMATEANVPRLPLEDSAVTLASVTELVKDMQREHDAQLAKERELVVHQVLQSLETTGLLRRKKPRAAKHTTKLDKRLQSLLHHSLSDTGLHYPHVVPVEASSTVLPASIVRPLVLERREHTDESMDARMPAVSKKRHTSKRDILAQAVAGIASEPTTVDVAASSKLAPEKPPELVEPILRRSKRSANMDKKTWVILEQSKKLLQATKASGYKPGVIAPKPHFEEFCAQLTSPNSGEQLSTAASITTPIDPTAADATGVIHDGPAETMTDGGGNNQPDEAKPVPASYQLSLLEPFPTSLATENTDKAWENELARQILSLYATSMSTKKHQQQHLQERPLSASPTKSDGKYDSARGSRRHSVQKLPALTEADRKKRIQYIQDSWQPSHVENGKVVLCMPKIPKPIWFAGTGIVMATWCSLAVPVTEAKLSACRVDESSLDGAAMLCRHKLCHELRHLEHDFEFEQYLAVVETLLMSRVRAKQPQGGAPLDELDLKLWKQFVITANAFASRAIDLKKFPLALTLVKKTEAILDGATCLSASRTELLAYIADTYAYYYYSRNKASAAMTYLSKAHGVHSKHGEWSHLAKCKLHMANLLSKLEQHPEAVVQLQLILALVEEAKLEDDGGGASAQKLCLVAVCYNNLALEQLHLKDVDGAATSSQNARRLARLCLSYSNRWLRQFENTHKAVIRAMATIMGDQGDVDMELVMKYDLEA